MTTFDALTVALEPDARARLEELAVREDLPPARLAAIAAMAFLDREAPPRASATKRQPGKLKGRIRIAPDFDDTPPEVLDSIAQGIEPG